MRSRLVNHTPARYYTKFMSNVLEAISKLKLLKNSKNHFSILDSYLPAYSYRVHAYETMGCGKIK